jgi:3'-5' exoribonuclease
MKSPYLSDLKPNQVITTTFLVHGKDVRQKKSGDPYLSLLLGDRTGESTPKCGTTSPKSWTLSSATISSR